VLKKYLLISSIKLTLKLSSSFSSFSRKNVYVSESRRVSVSSRIF